MKTLFLTHDTHAVIRAKQQDFERKTGLKWDAYSAHGGTHYTPIITRNTPFNEDAAEKLLPHLRREEEQFTKLSERSGLPLAEVLETAKTLVQSNRAVPQVNRMGHFAFIRAKHPWEK